MKKLALNTHLQGIILLAVTVFSSHVTSVVFNATIEKDIVSTGLGDSENLLCSIPEGEEVRACLWAHSPFHMPNVTLDLFELFNGNETGGNANFTYFGKGLKNGDCGLKIESIEEKYLGFWNCTLVSKRHKTFTASIQLKLSEKCRQPTLEKSNLQTLVADNKTGQLPLRNISCCMNACEPRPKLSFLIDKVKQDDSHIQTEYGNTSFCIRWNNAQLQTIDNGKELQCEAKDQDATSFDSLIDIMALDIKYAPVFYGDGESWKQSVPSGDKTVNISVQYSGNPIPNISWSMKKSDDDTFSTLVNGGIKYDVHVNVIKGNIWVWESTLTIKDFKKLDLEYYYILSATNLHGTKTITVKLDDYVGLSNWLLIAGAILIVIFAVVTISLVVWALKKRHLLCFRTRVPITKPKQFSPRAKHSGASYARAPTVDTVPKSGKEEDIEVIDITPKANTRSSIVSDI